MVDNKSAGNFLTNYVIKQLYIKHNIDRNDYNSELQQDVKIKQFEFYQDKIFYQNAKQKKNVIHLYKLQMFYTKLAWGNDLRRFKGCHKVSLWFSESKMHTSQMIK